MKKATICVERLLSVCCLGILSAGASADVYYCDDFETQPITTPGTELSLPPVGLPYHYTTGANVAAVNVVSSPLPVLGTKSLEALRDSTIQPNVAGVSLDNAIVSGKTVQWEFSHQLSGGTGTAFNAPMQVSLGYTNGGIGRLAWITILDRNSLPPVYCYSDAYISSEVRTTLAPTIGGWDRIRLVMTPMESTDFPGYVTGKYDMYISLNGAPEVLAKSGADLEFSTPPQLGEEYYGDLRSTFFRIQKGPFTSNSYYDNISLRDYASWNVNAAGTWTTATNWSPNTAPNNGTVANFGPAITSPKTVTVDAPHSVSTLRFESANRYTIAGSGMLTLAFGYGDGAQIDVAAGSHTISAPLTLATNTKVDVVDAADTLTISGPMTGTGVKLTKAGAGRLEVANLRVGSVQIKAGVLKVLASSTPGNAAGASLTNSLAIEGGAAPTATLDLTNNGIAVDYTGTSPLSALRAQIIAGFASGKGIVSSSITAGRSIGIAEASNLSVSSFLGQTVDGSSVLIRYTIVGDADLNGSVNFDDLLRLAQNYGSANGAWSKGDSNYSGTVDFDDLLALAQRYGTTLLESGEMVTGSRADFASDWYLARSMVPEPVAAGSLMALAAIGRRRRC